MNCKSALWNETESERRKNFLISKSPMAILLFAIGLFGVL